MSFGAVGTCRGLDLDYWTHWRSIYSPHQFAGLLANTFAHRPQQQAAIAFADEVFGPTKHKSDEDFHSLRALILANQLSQTLPLHPELRNPQEGSLYYGCVAQVGDSTHTLIDALSNAGTALRALADEDTDNDPTPRKLRNVKAALTAFMHLRPDSAEDNEADTSKEKSLKASRARRDLSSSSTGGDSFFSGVAVYGGRMPLDGSLSLVSHCSYLSVLGAVCLVGLVVVGALISRNKSKLKKRSSNSRLSAALPVTVLPN